MSTTNRRGFLGFLGAASAALPFLGNAVPLKVDPCTGALTIDSPKGVTIEPIADLPSGNFLIIPGSALRDVVLRRPRSRIDITSYEDDVRAYAKEMEDPLSITLRIEADPALAQNLYAQFSRVLIRCR